MFVPVVTLFHRIVHRHNLWGRRGTGTSIFELKGTISHFSGCKSE